MPAQLTRPNILFILADQQRWDTVGCYGQSPISDAGRPVSITPHLDRLAAEGVLFRHSFTCQPVCGPARACLQTGLYATQVGCPTNNRALPTDAITIAKLLGGAGYETAYVGKWHLAADPEHPYRNKAIPAERRGGWKDYWVAADTLEFTSSGYEGFFFDGDGNRIDWEGYRADRTTDFMLDYLRDYSMRRSAGQTDRPFVAFLSYIEPHQQNDLNRYIGPMGSKQRFADFTPPEDLARAEQEGDWRRHYPDYLGCCASLDDNLARLRAQLEADGLWDNTLIFYTADHGCHFRTRNGEYKRSCHDASLRTPLIVRGPGFEGGRVIEELVSLIDLPPTIIAAGGVDVPAAMRGRALQPLATGAVSAGLWGEDVFAQISESEDARAVRTAQWTYGVVCVDVDPVTKAGTRWIETYLYDNQADPHQLDNRVADSPLTSVKAEMAERLRHHMRHAGEAEPVIELAG